MLHSVFSILSCMSDESNSNLFVMEFILRFPTNILFEYLTQRFFNSIISRSIRPGVFLVKGVLKKRSKSTGEHPCWSVISIKRQPCRSMILIKLLCNFIEFTLRHGCFPVNFLYIFRGRFSKKNSWWLLLNITLVFIPSRIRRDYCQLWSQVVMTSDIIKAICIDIYLFLKEEKIPEAANSLNQLLSKIGKTGSIKVFIIATNMLFRYVLWVWSVHWLLSIYKFIEVFLTT